MEVAFDYNRSYDFSRDGPKSPDPEDSPLAASILNGVKEIDRNTWVVLFSLNL